MSRRITRFTRQNLRELRSELDEALRKIGRPYGVAIQVGSGSFRGTSARLRIELRVAEAAGERIEAAEFRQNAPLLGLSPDDLGREFTVRGTVYRIVGAKMSRRRYPVIGENARGTRYVFAPELVRQTLLPRSS